MSREQKFTAIILKKQQFKEGDEIYGCAGGLKGSGGALAEYMLVDAKLIAKKPKSLSMLEAAALPLVSITAWEALFKKAHLSEKNTILIKLNNKKYFQRGADGKYFPVTNQTA